MMARLITLILPCLLLLSSCDNIPESAKPLPYEVKSCIDPELIGIWTKGSGDYIVILHFCVFQENDSKYIMLVLIDKTVGDAHCAKFKGHCTTIKGDHYLSLQAMDKNEQDEKNPAYVICKYKIADGKLLVSLMHSKYISQFVASGKLKGTIVYRDDKSIKSLKITDTEKALVKFIEEHPQKAFGQDEPDKFDLSYVKSEIKPLPKKDK